MNAQANTKPSKPKYNMWQCAGYMIGLAWREREKKVLFLCLAQAFLAVATNLVSLYVTPAVLGEVERQATLSQLLTTVLIFTGLMALCAALSAYVGENVLYGRITVRKAIICSINRKNCVTSYPNTENDAYAKLAAKARMEVGSNDVSTEAVWTTLTSLMENAAGFAVYLAVLSVLDWRLIGVILAAAAIGYLVSKRLNGYGYRHRDEEAQLSDQLWYCQNVGGKGEAAKDIRIFGMRAWLAEVTGKTMAAFRAFHQRANNIYTWGRILDLALAFLRNGLAYAYLIRLVVSGGLSVAEFLLYFSAVGGFTQWVGGLIDNLTTLYRQGLDLSTVREFLEFPEPFLFEKGAALPAMPAAGHELRLDNVSYRYPGADGDTLTHIKLTLRPGEKIAVVGQNGAGKTTLVKLLCGFLDPTEGRVLLDGTDIRTLNRQAYYTLFSAVFQQFSLLAGTVAANVAQSEEDIDLARVNDCLEKAGLAAKAASLPKGCQTLLNRQVYDEAAELSGGELQRLMLARALYKNAPFIVLDEPTAALDPIAEADMYAKYNEMTRGHSSVYISHRLASTRFCDRILLIDHHVIAEEGDHAALLARGGKYAELFSVQSKYYKEADTHGDE